MKNIIAVLFLCFCILQLNAQHTNIMISNGNYPEEPSVFVNPKNTNQIIAGSNINNFYFSNNGGNSWTESLLQSSLYGVWGDPCLIMDTLGNFYFFHLSNPPFGGNWIDRIVCQKSTDNGATWNAGTYMGLNGAKAQDKEWAVVDSKNNNIYVSWTQFDNYGSSSPNDSSIILFSKSTDQGATWSGTIRISKKAGDCVDSDNTVEGAVPTVGPNGEIYVSWAGPLGIMFDRSLDQGNTWLDEDIFVSDFPGGWDYSIPGIQRCNGLPVTCCDVSNGPYRGNIYINWTDQRNGTLDTDVWFVKSSDGGLTWSTPNRVNDDAPGKQQFFTWMTIDQITGYIYFVFYDRRNYTDKNTDVYMAVSKNGGDSFRNFKISESPFIPNQNIFFGDYTNISAHNDVIRPIWTRLDNTELSVWTAIVDPVVLSYNDNSSPFLLEQNYPNPFTENTSFSYKIKYPCHISLKVLDLYGREVATLINNKFQPTGKYVGTFNGKTFNLSPGVYYFSLISENQVSKCKMLFLN